LFSLPDFASPFALALLALPSSFLAAFALFALFEFDLDLLLFPSSFLPVLDLDWRVFGFASLS
jgi:hypothetical protein